MDCKNFPEDVKLALSQNESLQLASRSIELSHYDVSNPHLYRHDEFENAASLLSDSTFDRLRGFPTFGNDYGTLVLKNLPVDPFLPQTPPDGRRPPEKLSVSESVAALIGCLIGDIFSYGDEKEGLLIQNICPVRGQEQQQENTGSVFLEFHTEDSFHPMPPDLLMLTCLRGDRTGQALTATASMTRALRVLDAEIVEILMQPRFIIRSSQSFGASVYTRRVSILSGTGHDRRFIFDPVGMRATDEDSEAAMQRLHAALSEQTYGFCLQPGEAIVIDNRKACHARTRFTPFYDGYDRWLQRIFLTQRFSDYNCILTQGTRMVDPVKAREIAA